MKNSIYHNDSMSKIFVKIVKINNTNIIITIHIGISMVDVISRCVRIDGDRIKRFMAIDIASVYL